MTRSIKVLVVGFALAGIAHSATAARKDTDGVNAVQISYADLNLQKEAGAAELLSRLSRAARRVCDIPAPGASNLRPQNERSICRQVALQNAVNTVNHPVVTALHQSMQGVGQMKLASR